jgi:nitrous oxidase accessory protein NosD
MSPTTSRYHGSRYTALALATAFAVLVGQVNASLTERSTVTVQMGSSIQNAINKAKAGDTIIVAPGTYKEQLVITTDRITLMGGGATLSPPDSPVTNFCTGTAGPGKQAGICVKGKGVMLEDFDGEHQKVKSLGKAVQGVTITGFTITGFSGQNIAIYGGLNTKVMGTKLIDGKQYGLLSAGSDNTRASGNVVSSTTPTLPLIAMCMDDTDTSYYSGNNISGYNIALCVQTNSADIRQNSVRDCCIGVFVDPGVQRAQVTQNIIEGSNAACDSVTGIFVYGADKSLISQNSIRGQRKGGRAAAIIVLDDATTQPVGVASGNTVRQNVLRDNDLDLYYSSTGKGNTVVQNVCSTSQMKCNL